ncbi:MAG TPA: TIGR00730 family Rossman fold protein [Terriglobales bacterium]|nr:TIGR00730 family Rossman fold protein [Terriglobales bacterium]
MIEDTPFRSPLAYENKKFLDSPDGRVLRILSEYLEPLARFRRERIQDTVVFFGSARFYSRSDAEDALQVLQKPNSKTPGPAEEQEKARLAQASVDMAHYYEEARELAYMLTNWALSLPSKRQRFVVTTGGGPGIMEAANRGAREAGGKTIGLNINLPYEQMPNSYITPELNFEFHYFFMRKLWFAYLSKALIVFPGGFGTFDELFEILTLAQTEKLAKKIVVLMYGSEYWNKVVNFQAMVDSGVIAPEDMDLFKLVDSPEEGFEYLKDSLTKHHLGPTPRDKGPEIAKTRP